MIDFEIWWNSADADDFRAKHEEHDGSEFKPVWDAAARAMRASTPVPAGAITQRELIARAHTAAPHAANGAFITELAAALETLQRERDEAVRDAERYRELRRDKALTEDSVWIARGGPGPGISRWMNAGADQIVDAAIKSGSEG